MSCSTLYHVDYWSVSLQKLFYHAAAGDREALTDGKDDEDDEDEDDDEGANDTDQQAHDNDDQLHVHVASAAHARPRRLSELRTPDRIKPIPNSSSLFLFSPTNR